MPRFFVWSLNGDGDCVAYRLHHCEGEDVVLRIDEPWSRSNLEGIVPHTQAQPRTGDVVIFGTSKMGQEAAALQKKGFGVIGAAPYCDDVEMDRWFFIQECKRLGIKTPETVRFTSYDKARTFVEQRGERWVFKPSGDQESACTFVATDAEELLAAFDHLEKKIPQADFLLQHFEEGIEISLEGWFNGHDWIDGSWNATKETKKLMAGDIGPATGCSSNCVYPYDGTPGWAKKLHYKFTPMLRRDKYKGPFDLNMIVTKDAMYALEATPRFGLEGIQNFISLWHNSAAETFEQLAAGSLTSLDVDVHSVAAALRLSVGPYPFGGKDHRAADDIPVLIEDGDQDILWMSGIRAEEDGEYYISPTDGCVGALVIVATTVEKAAQKLVECAKRIHIPDLMYRNDVGTGHMKMWEELAKLGFDLPLAVEAALQRKPTLEKGSPFKKMTWM
jgi:phosphoribosylamine-glycine ligase